MQSNKLQAVSLALCAALFAASHSAEARPLRTMKGTVVKVVDGDTIKFAPNNASVGDKDLNIRMMTIDTPETKLPAPGGVYSQGYWGEEAWAELQRHVEPGDKVEVDDYGLDGYGRTLGVVYKKGVDINFEMAASGWASLYIFCDGKTDCETDDAYRDACENAVKKGLGIFDPSKPLRQLPFLFRAEKQQRELSKFVGNYKTKKFVDPDQWKKVPICDRVFFASAAIARREGYEAQE